MYPMVPRVRERSVQKSWIACEFSLLLLTDMGVLSHGGHVMQSQSLLCGASRAREVSTGFSNLLHEEPQVLVLSHGRLVL